MSVGSYRPFATEWQPGQPEASARGIVAGDVAAAVAGSVASGDGFPDWGAGADFRQFQRNRSAGVAAVAAVATPFLPWAEGLQLLRSMSCPAWTPDERWERLVYQALTLSRDWSDQADALGWSTIDLFGCNPEPWKGRADRDGLALLLTDWRGPMRVRAITTEAIALEVDHGRQLRFYHHERAGSVPLWIGFAQEGGP